MTTQSTPEAAAKRNALKKKLRALLAMTEANGCTEAEALAAAQKAADLMSEHDLSYETADDVKAERFGARKRDWNANLERRGRHEVQFVCNEIAKFFDCRVWQSPEEGTRTFFGTEHDTQAAHDMCDMLCLTMEGEFQRYLKTRTEDRHLNGRSVRGAFMIGMAERINARLRAIREVRDGAARQHATSTGRALVLVTKKQEVDSKYHTYADSHGLRLSAGRGSRRSIRSGAAMAAGRAAGDRANLGGGSIASGTRQIGR